MRRRWTKDTINCLLGIQDDIILGILCFYYVCTSKYTLLQLSMNRALGSVHSMKQSLEVYELDFMQWWSAQFAILLRVCWFIPGCYFVGMPHSTPPPPPPSPPGRVVIPSNCMWPPVARCLEDLKECLH